MIRSTFVRLTLGILSLHVTYTHGFSTSRILSQNKFKKTVRRNNIWQRSFSDRKLLRFEQGIILHIATDPTSATSHSDKNVERSYDFISLEEAEEALRRERTRYEGERSELQWLLEVQRQQLQDLVGGRHRKKKSSDSNHGNGQSNETKAKSSKIVILGTHSYDNKRKSRKKSTRVFSRNGTYSNGRKNTNNKDDTYLRMQQLENLLQDAIAENDDLTRRFREQHHQYHLERSTYEDELREERGRLSSVRDELQMERAYFETTRRMLEHLLDEEQQKVRELENQLMMISQEQMFSEEKNTQDEYEERQHQEQVQKQHIRVEEQQSQNNKERSNQGRSRARNGFTMNINDVQWHP